MSLSDLARKKPVKVIAGILLAFFLLYLAIDFYFKAFYGFAWDYSINWVAAIALNENVSLYDRVALQQLAIREIDSSSRVLFNGRFTSFLGLPTTAILHWPMAQMSYEPSVLCYRALALSAMLATIFLVGLSLPLAQRGRAWLTGLLCLLLWHGFSFSIKLGQVDAFVMLSLAITVLAWSRNMPKVAGVALAVAVLLKISPAWLLLYCAIKRQWPVVVSASAVIIAGLLLSLLPQQGQDLQQFLAVVLPGLGDSPLHVQNQSLAAWLARVTTKETQLLDFAAGVGMWKYVGVVIASLLMLLLVMRTHLQSLREEELAILILVALIAGPLTWDHYLTWALVPVMLLSSRLSWSGMLLLGVVLMPLVFPVEYVTADMVAANWWWRILTGVQVVTLCLLAMWMIKNCAVHDGTVGLRKAQR